MEIKVLGTGCAGCKALFETVCEAVNQLGIEATVVKEEDLLKIMEYDVMSLPALVIDGAVVSKGKRPSVEQVKELLR
ncbi:thioredoxin family protein [uncultured Alistipes sp.]|jgi:small redox-active disulfide protein 2|uniref:thioredoxin family protein n=1 Tax=uncultured Alistipes sp. TaxID=538949 RepID=UPI0025EE9B1F|nr:thioredoxin family protein [uncultured Alistipes sp.]